MAAAAAPLANVVVQLGLKELTQHTARLGAAKAENTAADECVPAYDADMQAIASAYRNGQCTYAVATQALEAVNINCYAYLSALVGKPGTAWNGSTLLASQGKVPCSKDCTVSCCFYFNDLYCGIYGCAQYSAGKSGTGAIQALAGTSSAGQSPTSPYGPVSGHTAFIPKVYPPTDSAYGTFERDAYTLDFSPPSIATASANANIHDTVAQLTKATTALVATSPKAVATATAIDTKAGLPTPAQAIAATSGGASSFSSWSTTEWIIAIMGILVVLGALAAVVDE